MTSSGASRGKAYVGCSGWSYTHWRGTVYDASLRPKDWFSDYARRFRTVEVNNTFYRLPEPATFKAWRAQAPAGFVYALKVNQYGTHRRRLRQPEAWLGNFVERAVLLGPNLGPNLVQLPPRWRRDPDRLGEFLEVATSGRFGTAKPALGGRVPGPLLVARRHLPAAAPIQGGAVRPRPLAGPPMVDDGQLGVLPVSRAERAQPEVLG